VFRFLAIPLKVLTFFAALALTSFMHRGTRNLSSELERQCLSVSVTWEAWPEDGFKLVLSRLLPARMASPLGAGFS
jgi:hypothetical protein